LIRLGLIGPGRVGRTLVRLLPQDKLKLGPVLSRNITSARRAVRQMKMGAATRDWGRLEETDVVLVTVPESALDAVVERLRKANVDYRDKIILHTSILQSSEVLQTLEERGASVGGLHPFYVFQRSVLSLSGVYFACEGSRPAMVVARQMVRELGGEFELVKPDQTVNHMMAFSMASDLATGLLEGSMRQMVAGGFTRRRGLEAISRLVEATIEEYEKSGLKSRPGPLLRRSRAGKDRCLRAFRSVDPEAAELYRCLASVTLRLLGREKEAREFAADV